MKTYEIKESCSEYGKLKYYNVFINNRFVSAYIDYSNALLKISNSLNKYKYCEKESIVKNVMFHSNKNYHNSIV